jgi:hypothetical protein
LLEIRPPKPTRDTIEDTEMSCFSKAKFILVKGVQVHQHSKYEEQEICPLFIPDAVGPASLLGLVKLRYTICWRLANVTLGKPLPPNITIRTH